MTQQTDAYNINSLKKKSSTTQKHIPSHQVELEYWLMNNVPTHFLYELERFVAQRVRDYSLTSNYSKNLKWEI